MLNSYISFSCSRTLDAEKVLSVVIQQNTVEMATISSSLLTYYQLQSKLLYRLFTLHSILSAIQHLEEIILPILSPQH